MSGSEATLLYDDDCGFCRWCVAVILVKDRHRALRPLPLQDPSAPALTPGLDATARMASWHLVGPDGAVHSGGAAITPLLRLLPGGSPTGAVTARLPGAVDRGYRLVVRHRGRLGSLLPRRARIWADRRIRRRIAG